MRVAEAMEILLLTAKVPGAEGKLRDIADGRMVALDSQEAVAIVAELARLREELEARER